MQYQALHLRPSLAFLTCLTLASGAIAADAPAPDTPTADSPVTVTLLRWPYT
ncbi:MAG: hypothetical protein AAF657_24520 [Acidobacteriota bacterium]